MELIIRDAQPSDADKIAQIHLETSHDAYRGIMSESRLNALSLDKRKAFWKEILADPKNTLLVAEQDGNLYGFCAYGLSRDKDADSKTGEDYAIYVDHKKYAQGTGSQLIQKAFQRLKKQAFSKATLWVLEANSIGKGFYEKQKMKLDGKTKEESIDGQALKEVRYSIELK